MEGQFSENDMGKEMKPRILFLLQVPPPIHGASLRNQSIAESQFLRKYFSIRLIPLRFVTEIKDIGTITITKFFRFAGFLFRYIGTVIFWRPRFIYFSLSPIGNAFYRDVLVVFIGKIFRIPFVFHLRGLGIKSEYPKGINRHLYRFVFRNNFVFCISNSQTEDITNLTFRKVYVVPDGIKQEVAPGEFLFKEQPIVLFLSNYIKSKGVLDFVEAIQILNRRGVDFKARMHGASWDVSKGDLEALIDSYNLKDKVIVGEPLFGNEKFKTILNADIFVLPTFL
jgi:Glycosyltransferase